MKEIIIKYLQSNYRISVASLKNFKLYDIRNDRLESLHSVFESLRTIFGITEEELETIVNPWIEAQATKLHNAIVDVQYAVYNTTGNEPIG